MLLLSRDIQVKSTCLLVNVLDHDSSYWFEIF